MSIENMKSSIRIIKQKPNDNSNGSKIRKTEKTAEKRTREMVSTVKSWIDEFKQKRRGQERTVLPAVRLVDLARGPTGQERAG